MKYGENDIKLRKLKHSDALRMLEWMHDPEVVDKLRADFYSKTLKDCYAFIDNSRDAKNLHLAISDDNDSYLGTVSLKNMSNDSAEFAIAICRDVMGTGCAIAAMRKILDMGFSEYGLHNIYWCVARDNKRAIRFYDKNGFKRIDTHVIGDIKGYTDKQIASFEWFSVSSLDY